MIVIQKGYMWISIGSPNPLYMNVFVEGPHIHGLACSSLSLSYWFHWGAICRGIICPCCRGGHFIKFVLQCLDHDVVVDLSKYITD